MPLKRIDTINVIPFIDIMLVLLAVVLTTATFIAQGVIPVTLPETSNIVEPADAASLRITITRQGEIHVGDESRTLETLDGDVRAHGQQARWVLSVDRDADFGRFVEVIDIFKRHHVDNLSIVARSVKQ